ncbi:MAG TPA: efflux RND transporter periplasmic adaptor subunit [Gemmataceae bacterium]|jgi:RND family efflux transporter MFP subunit
MRTRAATLLAVALALGCRHPPPPQPPPPPKVTVAHPVRRDVADRREYTGHIEAVESVDVRARVRGFLEKVNFQEGTEVKAGDLLYEIEPQEYQAAVQQAEADVQRLQAQLAQAESELHRVNQLRGTGAVTPEEVVARTSARDIARAQVQQAQAALATARLQLSYTKVTSPITGRIGRTLVTVGNLVGTPDPTLLTTVVRVDPEYVYFEAPEADYLDYQRLMRVQNLPPATEQSTPVFVGLATDRGFPHQGTLNFRDNRADPGTGTILLRGSLPNPQRVLVPGLYARVRVPFGNPQPRLLVPAEAVGADQRGRYVLVVKADDTVEYRPVTVGLTTDDHLAVIEKGVTADDWVVVNGVQKARPGAPVEPIKSQDPNPKSQ